MSQPINLQVTGYSRAELDKTIDRQFTQLGTPTTQIETTELTPTLTVQEFFNVYNDLFYLIPKTGETNSHQYLIRQSGEYVGGEALNTDLLALQEEIAELRTENLELQQTILTLQTAR